MVYKPILASIKKIGIPFGVASSSFLFINISKALAETSEQNSKIGTVTEFFFKEKEGILTKIINESGDSEKNTISNFFNTFNYIGEKIISFMNWLNHFPENISQFSVNFLTDIYKLLMLVLQTPLFIFNNSYLQDSTMTFSVISILIVTILSQLKIIKNSLSKFSSKSSKLNSYNDVFDIETTKRWSIATIASGIAPFAFEQIFGLINKVSVAITKIGASEMKSEHSMDYLKLSGFDTVTLLGFDLIVLALVIPLLLQNGRRFFDLMCLSAITPLALTAWVFDDYKHLHRMWINKIKAIGSVQLIYSLFISLMGIFIFGTRNVVEGGGLFLKIIIVLGGLSRMANIPKFILSRVDNDYDMIDAGSNYVKTAKSIYNTVTLKNLKPLNYINGKVSMRKKGKDLMVKSLRKQHGRRYVKDLL